MILSPWAKRLRYLLGICSISFFVSLNESFFFSLGWVGADGSCLNTSGRSSCNLEYAKDSTSIFSVLVVVSAVLPALADKNSAMRLVRSSYVIAFLPADSLRCIFSQERQMNGAALCAFP